jgi:hypothetical protein
MTSEKAITIDQYICYLDRFTPFKLLDEVIANRNDPQLKVVANQYTTLFMVSFRRMMHEMSKNTPTALNLLAVFPNSVIVAQEIDPISEGLKVLHQKANDDTAPANNQYVMHFRVLESLIYEIQRAIFDSADRTTSSIDTTTNPKFDAQKVPPSPIVPFNSDEPAEIYTGDMPVSH